jgi:hypothetical protein
MSSAKPKRSTTAIDLPGEPIAPRNFFLTASSNG